MATLAEIQTQQERAIFKAFTMAIQSVKDQAVISEIANLIALGRIEDVVELLQLDPATFRPLENATIAAYEAGGATGASQIGRIPTKAGTLVARFNVRNPRAEEFLRVLSSQRIVEIADDTREVVRTVLRAGMSEGAGPRTTALDLVGRIDPVTRVRTGGHIGLTSQQSQWVINARQELETLNPNYLTRALRDKRLDKAFERALESGKPMPAKQIDAAISRMQARAIRYRGEVIARTESLNALRSGQTEAIMQSVDQGELEEEFATKTWQDTGDGRTRVEHSIADGQTVPIDQPFIVGGERLMYPGDPNGSAANTIQCRCRASYRMNFAGQAAKMIKGFN